jgi:protein-S-isoprenylcysteine O-methyltransferase Ste14
MADMVKAALGLLFLGAVMACALFLPAGTLVWWQGWVFLAIFLGASLLITLYLAAKDPALLRRRLHAGPSSESALAQKIIWVLASIGFLGLLVVPALDVREGWSRLPAGLEIAGDALVALGFFVVFLTYRENSFTAATIRVESDQLVVATGPYSAVRHPMYAGALIMFVGMPLALGSWWGFLPSVALTGCLVWRLMEEEAFLCANLPGYAAYRGKVRARLVPGVF